ncbi:MAG TPA: class I SAM-dependent methyltransferase [Anaerolineae bacterium]|nr:class I SAM-dependent methyltransferase [Anaerolineae bacterium]HNU04463.1 class I SAM-dependent methyltransferase [Anaerolineae bacterium]
MTNFEPMPSDDTSGAAVSATGSDALPPLRIHDNIGVCGVRQDTRMLAEIAAGDVAPGRALDLGTGTGYIGLYLAQRGWTVDAVDVSPRAVELAQANAQRNGLTAAGDPGSIRVFHSNLFDQVEGSYDLIAFNPPMRPDETELSRIVTSLLRRHPAISRLLMNLLGERFEQGRSPFLVQVVDDARRHLRPGGRLVLGISSEEAHELAALPGLHLVDARPIPGMARQEIAVYLFEDSL